MEIKIPGGEIHLMDTSAHSDVLIPISAPCYYLVAAPHSSGPALSGPLHLLWVPTNSFVLFTVCALRNVKIPLTFQVLFWILL